MLSLAEIAQRTQGRVIGDELTCISGVGSLANARQGDLTYLSNQRYRGQLQATKAAAVLLAEQNVSNCPIPAIVVTNPQLAFAQIAVEFDKRERIETGIDSTARIDPTAQLGRNLRIGPNVNVGAHSVLSDGVELCANVCIGAFTSVGLDTSIRENVVVYHDVRIGARCTIHANTSIGVDGFGIVADDEGQLQEVPQVGRVQIGDDVLVGASVTIDRGTIDDTIIHDNVKIDDQVHIAHNCVVGAHSIMCGRSSLAGSVTLGEYCVLAGGVGIAGEGPVSIAGGVEIGAMTFVSRDITEPGRYSGSTLHTDNRTWRRNALRLNELDSMAKRLRRIEQICEKQERAE
ncbi:MAG: UDP-3-O-(3-hydroxymyristoyl)glucosamine N-acyltransferase [Gammaproteobacteria bacterium]|nr:UDP-3-O-(3-hydroxymyristoyl)glucosamine N-acyltransferase [Gammaproteobacteria bacterium]